MPLQPPIIDRRVPQIVKGKVLYPRPPAGRSKGRLDRPYLPALVGKDLHRAMGIYTAWIDAQMQSVAHFVAQEPKKG